MAVTAVDETPAQDLDAERAVIGAVLLAGTKVLDAVSDLGLAADDMYAPRHESIYATALALSGRGEPIDHITVATALGPDLPRIGGLAVLHDCVAACISPASAPHYARIVADHAVRRRLTAAGHKVMILGQAVDAGSVTDAVDAAQAAVAAVAGRLHGQAPAADMGTALDDVLTHLETGDGTATPTGITDLDRLLVGGLRPGTLTTIAARPGAGKTVLGLQIALHIATTGGHVGYTSLEMTRQDLLLRGISATSAVDYGRLQRSPREPLTEREWVAVSRATETLRGSGLAVSHRTSATVDAIRADIRDMIRTAGACDAWIVDYLQLVSPADRRAPREQQVSAMTRHLKMAALETGVPVVILAQLNRDGEKSGRQPILTDLRESGAIEQDSDTVILLHRQDDHPDKLGLRLAKNRRGPQGDISLIFEGSYQRVSQSKWAPSNAIKRT